MKTFDIDDSGFEFMQGIRRCGAFVYRVDISEGEKKMKTFDRKDVYSWANCDELRLATQGYVGNSLSDLACNIAPEGKVVLLSIDKNSALCFNVENKQDNLAKIYHFAFFLPADKVKEVEKKEYRPFSLEEFLNKFSIGTKISFRRRDITRSIYGLFEGYQTDKYEIETYHKIIICNVWYTLNDLFETYEYLDEHGEWQPFGVEE